MTGFRPGSRKVPGAPSLGGLVAGQLFRLCEVAGLGLTDALAYTDILIESLGPVAERPLDCPPPSTSFLSDDHTPVEFSLSYMQGGPPALRVLLEPGAGAGSLVQNGRTGLKVIRDMAQRWNFASDKLDEVEDLFFPPSPEGPLALWCALELRPGGVPKVKVYLNPAASGPDRSAETVREALRRLGHREAFAALPQAAGYPFFALDLGGWEAPRVKVYLRHDRLSAADAGALSCIAPASRRAEIQTFFRMAAGSYTRIAGRPALSCHSFTESVTGLPSGCTLHIPVRDYVGHDGEALARAVAVLRRHGMDTAPLLRSLAAVTSRRPQDGVGLIAYLALAHEQGRPTRVTTYISSEAYAVRSPVALPSHRAETVH